MRLIDADELKKQQTHLWDEVMGHVPCVLLYDIDKAPTVDAVPVVAHEQVRWERDVAIAQLKDYGVSFGEKADCAKVVRCKDCKHTDTDGCKDPAIYCKVWDRWEMPEDGFCSYGERRSE